ncbi:MAG: hypothetical protein RQ756_04385 [Flavobacteriaceae bacterium]|nr:hypothetical protein [Flavobacteriaceae bacterium]
MRFKWRYLRLVLLLLTLAMLYGFAKQRHAKKPLQSINISYSDSYGYFVTEEAVNKLLIQKNVHLDSVYIESLDLKMVESSLEENPMIKSAEVSLSIDQRMSVVVHQRKPIARVMSPEQYYIDDEAKAMPLSTHFTARVPLVYEMDTTLMHDMAGIIQRVAADEVLANLLSDVTLEHKNKLRWTSRDQGVEVLMLMDDSIEDVFNRLKVFYAYAKNKNIWNKYTELDLSYKTQVVGRLKSFENGQKNNG